MNLLWFVLIGLAIFFSLFLGGRKYRGTALYALAIGGIVNANFFHAGNYPIDIFGLDFGIDSIIYTVFVFCVIVMYFEGGRRSAYILMFSSVIAILFSALIQLLSTLLSIGASSLAWAIFGDFVISALASVIAVTAMLEILHKLKIKNSYVCTVLGILITSVLNSAIYYPLSTLINGMPDNIVMLLTTSFSGKAMAMVMAVLTLYVLNTINARQSGDNRSRGADDDGA